MVCMGTTTQRESKVENKPHHTPHAAERWGPGEEERRGGRSSYRIEKKRSGSDRIVPAFPLVQRCDYGNKAQSKEG